MNASTRTPYPARVVGRPRSGRHFRTHEPGGGEPSKTTTGNPTGLPASDRPPAVSRHHDHHHYGAGHHDHDDRDHHDHDDRDHDDRDHDAGPDDAGPDHAGPDDAGPDHAGPDHAGPDDAGPDDAGPDDAGPDDAGHNRTWPTGCRDFRFHARGRRFAAGGASRT
jgi:hypothetical protein